MLKLKMKKLNKINNKKELLENKFDNLAYKVGFKVAKKLKISYDYLIVEQMPYTNDLSISISFYKNDIEFKTVYVDYENNKAKIIDYDEN